MQFVLEKISHAKPRKETSTLSLFQIGSLVAENDKVRNVADWPATMLSCITALEQRIPVIQFHKSKLTLLLRE